MTEQDVSVPVTPVATCQFPVGLESAWRGPADALCGNPTAPRTGKVGAPKIYCEDPQHTPLRAHRLRTAARREGAGGGDDLVLDDDRLVTDSAAAVPVLRAMWTQALDGRQSAIEASNRELAAILTRAAELAEVLDDPEAAAGEVTLIRTRADAEISAATSRAGRAERAERDARRQADEAIEVRDEAVKALEQEEIRAATKIAQAQTRMEELERETAAEVERVKREAAEQITAAQTAAEAARTQAVEQVETARRAAAEQITRAQTAADERVAEAEAAAQARIEQAERTAAEQVAQAQDEARQAREAATREHDQAVRDAAAAEAARNELGEIQRRRDREEQRHEQEITRLRDEHREQRERDNTVQIELREAHQGEVRALRAQLEALTRARADISGAGQDPLGPPTAS